MNRDRLINVALFLAGVLLAIALFSAGAIWRSRSSHHVGAAPTKAEYLPAKLIPASCC